MSLIPPRTLKGFRDLLPEQALRRARLVRTVEDVFRQHGYAPIDTPILEYAEILKGKGGGDTDKELFEFTDKGGREVALRFDLTVPLARFVAEHQGELVFPFRRYHIGLVFRGERPQRGRAREFLQCDADIIGAESSEADAEILVLMAGVYAALGVGQVTLRVNDRRVLSGLLDSFSAAGLALPILRALDKREKQGDDVVRADLVSAGLPTAAAQQLLDAAAPSQSNALTLQRLREAVGRSAVGVAGVQNLERLLELLDAAGVPGAAVQLDPGIARGLDYYTGMVLEARLESLPEIGSVGSGGRYDDLAALYTRSRLPGVGCSIGITRLMDALEALEQGAGTGRCTAQALIVNTGPTSALSAFAFASQLRAAGLSTEVYPEEKKHAKQMHYADRQGIAFVFTPDPQGGFHGKRMLDGATRTCATAAAAAAWMREPTATPQEPGSHA